MGCPIPRRGSSRFLRKSMFIVTCPTWCRVGRFQKNGTQQKGVNLCVDDTEHHLGNLLGLGKFDLRPSLGVEFSVEFL